MRNLFLALVLANLAFAAWRFWFAETDAPVSRAVSEAPTITLIDELEEAGNDEEIAERCVSIGPFAERSQADAVTTSLRVMGFEAAVAEFTDVDPEAPFWIDVVGGGLAIPGTEQLQPFGLDLLAPSDEDASQSPATVMSLTLRACASAAD